MRRDLGDEVEFQTLMWFSGLDAIKDFMGEEYAVSHVPAAARAVLKRANTVRLALTSIDNSSQKARAGLDGMVADVEAELARIESLIAAADAELDE